MTGFGDSGLVDRQFVDPIEQGRARGCQSPNRAVKEQVNEYPPLIQVSASVEVHPENLETHLLDNERGKELPKTLGHICLAHFVILLRNCKIIIYRYYL